MYTHKTRWQINKRKILFGTWTSIYTVLFQAFDSFYSHSYASGKELHLLQLCFRVVWICKSTFKRQFLSFTKELDTSQSVSDQGI